MALSGLAKRLTGAAARTLKKRLLPSNLREGDTAPEWRLQSHDGTWYGHTPGWAVLQFLPFEPGDELVEAALADLKAHHERLTALGADMVVVMPAGTSPLAALATERGLPYPLLADEDALVARLFRAGVTLLSLEPVVVPTCYLVNPEGRIRLANRGAPAMDTVARSIIALKDAVPGGV